jgi:DNA ligase (NAD+)
VIPLETPSGTSLGACLQVCARTGRDSLARHHHPGGPYGRTHAGGGIGTCFFTRQIDRGRLCITTDEIRLKDIRIGDTVLIQKAGEVVPAVVEVILSKRPASAEPFDFASHVKRKCPRCGAQIHRDPKLSVWQCPNIYCPAQITRRLEYMAKRTALDLEGLGGIVADKLIERNVLTDPLQLFELEAKNALLPLLSELNLGTETEPRFRCKKCDKARSNPRAVRAPCRLRVGCTRSPFRRSGETIAHEIAACHSSFSDVAHSELLHMVIRREELRTKAKFLKSKVSKSKYSSPENAELLPELQAEVVSELTQIERALLERGFAQKSKRKDATESVICNVGPVVASAILQLTLNRPDRPCVEQA